MGSREKPLSICYSIGDDFSRPPSGVLFEIAKGRGPVYERRILAVERMCEWKLHITIDSHITREGLHLPITDIVLLGDIDKCLDADDDLAAMWLANDKELRD